VYLKPTGLPPLNIKWLITGVLFLVKFIYKRTKVRVPEAFTLPLRKRVKFIKGKAEVNITIS
jgi:hypothetical protein